jgi:CHAT domain-containing protein/tetratricopeptide (TPR) repeat protein
LTRPSEKHLDDSEMDALVSPPKRAPGSGQISEPLLREARRHLDSCQDCSRKVQMHESVQGELSRLAKQGKVPPSPDCPGDVNWLEVAAGLLPETKTREFMQHASQCGHCGPLLRSAADALSDGATANEEELLAGLGSAQSQWQRNMAGELRKHVHARQRKPERSGWQGLFSWPRPAFAVVAIAVAIAAGWLGLRLLIPPSAEQLLARAYAEHRTLEVRIPGAKYAPMRVERGTSASNLDKSPSLLKAEALIGENLSKHPNDPSWLQARARADLLDGNYESAITSLQRALEAEPDSPSLLTDLGSAYFLRAESADRPIDYGNAIESLGKVLSKDPDEPVALFNHALACGRMFLYTQAVNDWEHYLRVDPQSEWSDDARKHLAAIKQKLEQHEKTQAEPLLMPSEIARGSSDDPALRARINGHIEAYLSLAVTEWLPKAFPAIPAPEGTSRAFRTALETLARITSQEHKDSWLADLLSGAESPHTPLAVADLAQAILNNDKADTGQAQRYAAEADRKFSSAGNRAGSLRARLEYLVATNIAQDGNGCAAAASVVERDSKSLPYPWIQGQLHTERGGCFFLLENLGTARQEYMQAAREAEAGGYGTLYLRTQDHLAVLQGASGDLNSGWRTGFRALATFWSGAYPNVRGYNLYYALYEFSHVSGQPHLQLAVWRDGLVLGEHSSDTAQRAMAHFLMATAAETAAAPQLAEREFTRAQQLFAMSPQIDSTRIASVEAEVRLARVENAQGQGARAISRLTPLEAEINQLSDNFLAILFYTTLGNAQARAGSESSAESSFGSAIALAEVQLRSLRDDKSRIDWDQQSSEAYRNSVQLRLHQGDVRGALEIWEWYRGAVIRSGGGGHSDVRPVSKVHRFSDLHEVADQIPTLRKETVISYALLPDGLATWVYDDRGVVSHWVTIPARSIEAKVARFRRLCSTPSSDESLLRQDARALYDALISPIDSHLSPGRALVVELDDGLTGLPFDALIDNHNRYLSERLRIVSSLGAYYRPLSRASAGITAETAALVAAVSTSSFPIDPPAPPLPNAISEGEMVARSFRSASLLTGEEASVGAVVSRLSSTSIFHFVGHAFSSTNRTGLLLSDGLLTASSLKPGVLTEMQLAVFSGCDTQDGSTGGVTSADSLVGTFLRAGVPRVIASRWSVDSSAAGQFMTSFYRALLSGNSTLDSIHQAQLDLRSTPAMAHPYYWSAFTVFGIS